MKYRYAPEQLEAMERNPWLTDRQRLIFDLFYHRGWPIERIAAEIDRTRGVVSKELKIIRAPPGSCT